MVPILLVSHSVSLFTLQCCSWVKRTAPNEPSFCFLYWKSVRGHEEIVWEGKVSSSHDNNNYIRKCLGPEHMRSFVENYEIIKQYKKSALSKGMLCASNSFHVAMFTQIA